MKFPSHGLVYDYALEDGGVSRKDDDDDDDHKAGEVRTLKIYKESRVTTVKFILLHFSSYSLGNMILAKNLFLKAKNWPCDKEIFVTSVTCLKKKTPIPVRFYLLKFCLSVA